MANHQKLPLLKAWFESWIVTTGEKPKSVSILPLVGDGSSRTFYRVQTHLGSYILVSDPEWTMTQDYAPHQEFLQERGLPTPEFFSVDPSAGILLMEDLGDELLQFRIQKASPEERTLYFNDATQLLAELHDLTFPVPPEIPAATRSFDKKKYLDELQYTEEHLLIGLFGELGWSQKEGIRAFCNRIAEIQPQVFCHRDYHTRNLILHEGRLFLIDFQDARLGSPHYDLASLLFDAYIDLKQEEQLSLVQLYQNSLGTCPLFEAIQWDTFWEDLNAVALQRTLKAAGSFASFYTKQQKTSHLKYIPAALRNALTAAKACHPLLYELSCDFEIERWIELANQNPLIMDTTTI